MEETKTQIKSVANGSDSKNIASTKIEVGTKTMYRLGELPVVNSAYTNVTDYYGKAKESSAILRTAGNLAELSFKTVAFAATPFTALCKKPLESVDSYLCEKVDSIEKSYPVIAKPTEQLTAQAKEGLNSIVKASGDQLTKSAKTSVSVIDSYLDSRYARLITDPVLDFTEKKLDYWIPGETKSTIGDATTLKRLYDINNRVCKHLYSTTFSQLNKLHLQFEHVIAQLAALKKLGEVKATKMSDSLKQNTLVAKCSAVIEKNFSYTDWETYIKTYSKTMIDDAQQLVAKYLALVKNFPGVVNGTRITQMMDNLKNQLNKESLSANLQLIIDQLKAIQITLQTYTHQMGEAVSNMKIVQLIKRTPSRTSSLPRSRSHSPSDLILDSIAPVNMNTIDNTRTTTNEQNEINEDETTEDDMINNTSATSSNDENEAEEDEDDDEEASADEESELNESNDSTSSS